MNTFTAIIVYLHARFVQFVDTFMVNHDLSKALCGSYQLFRSFWNLLKKNIKQRFFKRLGRYCGQHCRVLNPELSQFSIHINLHCSLSIFHKVVDNQDYFFSVYFTFKDFL